MWKSWVLAFRPKTLTAALVPIFVATSLVFAQSSLSAWWISLFALFSALFIQIGTNLINDASDFKKGADTSERIGPQRVTQSGIFTSRQVFLAGGVSFLCAVLLGIPLVLKGGMIIVAIGIVSVICGYAYTAGPYPLAYKGLGDLFVILFFGLVAVSGVFYLHVGVFNEDCLIAGLQVGCLATVLIAVNNLRDVEGDRKAGKQTLAVRWGVKFARWEIAIMAITPFVLNLFWWEKGWKWPLLLSLLALPLAWKVVRGVFLHSPSPMYNQFLGKAAALQLAFGLLLSFGFLLQ